MHTFFISSPKKTSQAPFQPFRKSIQSKKKPFSSEKKAFLHIIGADVCHPVQVDLVRSDFPSDRFEQRDLIPHQQLCL